MHWMVPVALSGPMVQCMGDQLIGLARQSRAAAWISATF